VYLASLGIPRIGFHHSVTGEEKPFDPAHTEEAWQKKPKGHSSSSINITPRPPSGEAGFSERNGRRGDYEEITNTIGWIIVTSRLLLYGVPRERCSDPDKEADRLYSQSDTNRKDLESLKGKSLFSERKSERSFPFKKRNQNCGLIFPPDRTLQSEVRVLTSGVEEYKDVAGKPRKSSIG